MEAVVIALIMIVTAGVVALTRGPGRDDPRRKRPAARPVPPFQDAVHEIKARKKPARRGKGEGSSRDRRS